MKFMFSTVYRVTQKDFYARLYTSMWAPVVARQILHSKWYSNSCHMFISAWAVISWRSFCLAPQISRFDTIRLFCMEVHYGRCVQEKSLRSGWFETMYHWSSWAYNNSHADKHVARAWISFRFLSSYNICPHWSVRTCIKIFLSSSVHCWKHKFHKAFKY